MAELTIVGQSKAFDYTGGIQSIELAPGTYQLEVWGASSGGWGSHVNAPGGYSRGVLTLMQTTVLYVVCGGKGKDAGHYSDGTGYNGGGLGNGGASSGGGATHIALRSGVLSSLENYKSSVLMVAGGGGSNGWSGSFGIGGGLTGVGLIQKLYNGVVTYDNMHGTQTHGGTNGHPGSFGQGGGSTESATGGGGGGWYGGSGSGGNVSYYPGGGGGSGYVNTACLTNASTHAGDETFNAPQGGSELGHVGNGAARITKINPADTSYIFGCTGSIQSISLSPGTYKLEAWGAEGGYAAYANASYMGGKGGYSYGVITLTEPTVLYVGVGGAGVGDSNGTSPGGFNGGGNGMCRNSAYAGTSGGGATHFALSDGVLSSLASRKSSVLLVAGGGGGAGTSRYNSASLGGCGGGAVGGNGTGSYSPGSGGTQSGGGASYNSNGVSGNTGASFGQGSSVTGTNGNEGSGGGGGWYGGGSGGTSSGGGGGSGYVNTNMLSLANTMSGSTDFVSPTGATERGHSGSGVAKITRLSSSTLLALYEFQYTGAVQSIELNPGMYTLEVWGAQGGYGCGPGGNYTVYDYGGLGGYATGMLTLSRRTTVYVYVGGKGGDGRPSYAAGDERGGFNGGGNGTLGGGGGGATDIRLNDTSLSSRVIVAGGGGGASIDATNRQYGGHGGGLNGQAGGSGGAGGTQTSGYALGQGGPGVSGNNGGGGGGYYGGYGGNSSGDAGGGGGSGYIGGVTDGYTIAGTWSGNGFARITALSVNNIIIRGDVGIDSTSSSPDVTAEILEDNTAVDITAIPKPGYTFDRWDLQYGTNGVEVHTREASFQYVYFADSIAVFTSYATPNTDTPYTVNHYIMDADGQSYSLYQTDSLQGTTDTVANAETLNFPHHIAPAVQNVNINGDGTTVINYYYARQKFKLKVFEAVAGGKDTTLYNEDAYWGKPIFLSTTALPGYTFTAWMHDGTEYVYIESQNYPFEMPTQDLTLRPLFTPHDVEYIVYHKLLGDDLSTYETFETDHLQGLTDTNVTPSVKKYDYYDSPATQTVKINGDGSTVVNYLYSRTVYALTLTADKGKNAMSAPSAMYMWGKSVSITVTTLAGYAFEQWLDTDSNLQFASVATYTFLMPHRDLALHAVINPFEVKYTVKHHIQALEGGHQVRDTEELYALTDTEVTPSLKDYDGFVPTSSLETVNVNGDGSTLVNYYYERCGYTLIIKYSDEDIVETHYFFQESVDLYFDNKARLEPAYAFKQWYTDTTGLTIQQPFMTRTSFLMPARDGYVEAIIGENRKNTNIYKNIFPDEPLNMDLAYEYEQRLEKAIFDITQENHGFVVGNVLCLVDGAYKKARAEDSPLGNPVGIVSKVIDEDKFQLMKSGTMPYKEQAFTDTTILYLSNMVAGALVHYKYVTNKVYIPVAFYLNGRIIVSIQGGSIGADLAPYEEYENVSFEGYTEAELNDCVAIVLGGISE